MRNLIFITILAIILRFFLLGSNPPSLDWDEASLGYNAYSIMKNGVDEYGSRLPIAIRSFDDYKPPLYVYLTTPIVYVFGLSDWSIRFLSACSGVGLIIAVYLLLGQLRIFASQRKNNLLAILGAFFVTLSPWSLQFSRAAFEANLGIFLYILGIALFLMSRVKKRYLVLSTFAFVFSMYSYHSFRLLVPLFYLLAFLLWRKDYIKAKLLLLICGILLFLSVAPMLSNLGSRPTMVTVFNDEQYAKRSIENIVVDNNFIGNIIHNRRIEYASVIAKNYLDHFSFDFLFLNGDGGRQHHAVAMGMLYLFDFIFIVAGIIYLVLHRSRAGVLLLLIFIIAPIPSAVTTGTPNPVRGIGMMPFFHIFVALGIIILLNRRLLKIIASGVLAISVFYYLHQYYIHTPIEYGDFWQYGYKELFSYLKPLEGKYDKIVVTYRYDQPYIYYLLYNKVDPKAYGENWKMTQPYYERMWRQIGKYEFRNLDFGKDSSLKNTILVGTPGEIPEGDKRIIKEIRYLDGSVAFRIVSL